MGMGIPAHEYNTEARMYNIKVNTIPETSTISLSGLGLLSLLIFKRRKIKAD